MPTAHAFLLAFCIGIITFSYAAGDTDPCSKGNWSDWYGNKQDCSNKGLLDQAYACPGLEFITDMQIKLNSDRTVLVASAIFAVSAIFIKYHLDKRFERFRGQLQGAGRMKDSSAASADVERGEAAGCSSADADQGVVQDAK
ncbi:hypothetical protein COCSUDRAFT_55760 [Coccomyxa subellipsoidea C-169]|uniref:Uncharacterized protein n=1 Tax=Coccomyxa subellipsoidea (strain C-169) TaxID=574566 RepID=I0ZAV9_COCSC|nr:hypothetical protein COCSUDRAFT_55760 [Coccomyxa subellipsoidea C-169]EIE27778.1 hypothetical protein COCSUDRAFT_55760 [Coccomyxa subellipsoidea C-169]|eukprot:XP_005652322.1 hypothetical protein COCSUDRAFT_55760 [Coccomyxa subellipsoidea C-169]